ncbi:hypothetical protein B0H66DRAFT_337632 [Apodospora peruviana]|uniref:Reverse transcriptase domain-containing protein n=1 Tax=Apodospora peruviana TaxID=516989 RepID=A0AAE0M137_9PEZI|nr:hypothetical protein B0H66DRAFT_337632 [Apodospora peruviana]
MRYVGFEDDWIDFFRKYLEAPLNLDAASDYRPQLGPRTRMRGVPMAHASEKLIGELVLSFMDIAVNRKTGILLYRLHDDIWFCGEPEVSAQAWTCMESYAKVFGLEFNRKKTGSVYLHGSSAARDPRIVQTLPQGPVTVGFLSLDPESGKWAIDQARMGAHLDQLEKQLKGCSSVLAWVLTWNSCIGRFFSHTFGEPAFCLGSEHVDAVLDTYSRMLKKLFPTGSVVEHLKSMIQSRFNLPSSANLPDAFIYLPEQLGGLGLRNPFVPLFLVRKNITTSAESEIRSFLLREFNQYRAHKTTFDELPKWRRQSRLRSICLDEDESDDSDDDEEGNKPEDNDDDDDDTSVDDSDSASNTNTRTPAIVPSEAKTFMSLTEFGRFRERNSMNLHKMYSNMLSVPGKEPIKLSKEILDALSDAQNDDDSNTQGSSSAIRRGGFRGGRARGRGGFSSGGRQMTQEANPSRRLSLTPENKWFLALYVDELMETYGGLSLVDKQFLPGGTLSMMRDKKVTWQMVL